MAAMQSIFKFRCPKCDKKHGVPSEFIGKVVQCTCGKRIHVMVENAVNDEAPAARSGSGESMSLNATDSEISSFFDDGDGQWTPNPDRPRRPRN